MKYFVIEPEVAGGLGEYTILDTTVHPPNVRHLHYEFYGWLGDDIVESFPCLMISQRLAELLPSTLRGFELAEVEISKSDEFEELQPGQYLPAFMWLKVHGTVGVDDFSVAKDHRFVISELVRDIFHQVKITNCEFEDWEIQQ
jgi:hypothetical protein